LSECAAFIAKTGKHGVGVLFGAMTMRGSTVVDPREASASPFRSEIGSIGQAGEIRAGLLVHDTARSAAWMGPCVTT
jgi:hypothetical protein